MRIAAFGFRSIPPTNGAAGADKFALELLPRLVKRGHSVTAYNRKYRNINDTVKNYNGVKIKSFSTVELKGFDTLIHSFKCTLDIIWNNSADIVHIQNGGNSIWSLPLRLFGKKVFISQDGCDWKRDKWPWYGKFYLRMTAILSAYVATDIIFDNIIAKNNFERKYRKTFKFIPFGSEIEHVTDDPSILTKLGLMKNDYFLFVGRFIPDKGLHYLIPAFIKSGTSKKLVLVGGSPNPSSYEAELIRSADKNVTFAGYVYGDDVTSLMLNSYCYIQPSDIEGLSPVVLSVMGLGVPLIVSDIAENIYAVQDTAIKFKQGDILSLAETIQFADNNINTMKHLAKLAKKRALEEFNWEKVTDDHVSIFKGIQIENVASSTPSSKTHVVQIG